tara:strand:- start:387 stop:698 length:312 start_codon:yes stop_codon:yes gene_type:complete
MATTITYKITKLKRKLDSGLVSTVEFDITGTDGDHTHTESTFIDLSPPWTEAKFIQGMTPYTALTEPMVIEWVQKKSADLENDIKNIVQEKKTPTVGEGIPWS